MTRSSLLVNTEHKIRELEQVKLILMKLMNLSPLQLNQNSAEQKKSPILDSQPKNKIVNFRIPKTILSHLESQAQNQNKSVNLLVREILRKHVEWDKFYSKFDPVIIPKSIFDLLVSGKPDKKTDKIVTELHVLFLDLIMMRYGNTQFDSILAGIEDFLKDTNNEFEHVLIKNHHHLSIICRSDTAFDGVLQKLIRKIFSEFVSSHEMKFLATRNIFKVTWPQ